MTIRGSRTNLVRYALGTPVCRGLIDDFQRIQWKTGTRKSCGRWCFRSTETHVLPQTSVSSLIPSLTHPSDDTHRSCANTSSTRLKHRSTQTVCLCICFRLQVCARFGWFWECPNGGEKCQYRHALPAGFVLKSQRKAIEDAEKANTISLEEFLEVEVR